MSTPHPHRHHERPYPPAGTISGQSAGSGWEYEDPWLTPGTPPEPPESLSDIQIAEYHNPRGAVIADLAREIRAGHAQMMEILPMTAHIIPLHPRRSPRHRVGPAAQVHHTNVYDGGLEGPLLEITLTLKLREVTPEQRRHLNALLHRPQGLNLTLESGGKG